MRRKYKTDLAQQSQSSFSVGVKKYIVLEHKADLKIKVFGRNEEEVFSNALLGMMETIKGETKKPEERVEREVRVKSSGLANLLVEFLSEVLYLSQTNKEIYEELSLSYFNGVKIEGKLIGKKIESFGEDIKGVTYHDLSFWQKADKTWEATILFDV